MKYSLDNMQDINIAYIGGGSRGWAWGLMSDLASEGSLSGTVRLYDIDFQAAKNNEKIGNELQRREDVLGKWQYKTAASLQEALAGADFVVISILPGTFKEMESDVHEPEKYGIYQSVGDTTGPGGIIRALRTIPMFVEIGEAIKKYSPEAWVINYTNPMTLCVRTLYEVFPQVKAFGCCHEVFGTQHLLAAMLKDMEGIENVGRDEIKVNIFGINHFTWIDKATYKGIDVLELYKKFVDKYYETGFEDGLKDHWISNSFASANRVKFDLFKRYGVIAAAGDRHLAEFVPSSWYLKNPETVSQWKFGLTTVGWRVKDLENRMMKSRNLIDGKEEFQIKNTGEEGVKQIKALLGLGDFITNVNIPNEGQILDYPIGSVVETNALFTKDRITPVMSGKMPRDVQSLVIRHAYNQEGVLEAAINKDKTLAFNVFANDPLVNLGLKEAKELFESMIKNTKKYLAGWDR